MWQGAHRSTTFGRHAASDVAFRASIIGQMMLHSTESDITSSRSCRKNVRCRRRISRRSFRALSIASELCGLAVALAVGGTYRRGRACMLTSRMLEVDAYASAGEPQPRAEEYADQWRDGCVVSVKSATVIVAIQPLRLNLSTTTSSSSR